MLIVRGPVIEAGTAATVPIFLQDAIGAPVTGVAGTMTVKHSLNGAAWDETPANSPSEVGDGYYTLLLATSETGSADGSIVVYAKSSSPASEICMVHCPIWQYGVPADILQNQDKTGYSLSAAGITNIHVEKYDGTRTLQDMVVALFDWAFARTVYGGTSTPKIRNYADTLDRATFTGVDVATGQRDDTATLNFSDL